MRPHDPLTHVTAIACATACAFSSLPARAQPEGLIANTQHTAATLPQGRISLGILREEVGLFDVLSVGTYLPPWLAFPFLGSPVPNGFVKARDAYFGPFGVAARVGIVYLDASTLSSQLVRSGTSSASITVIPFDGIFTLNVSDAFAQSLRFTYTGVAARGNVNSDARVAGALVTGALTTASYTEVRLARGFFLTLLARCLVAQRAARISGTFVQDDTLVEADIGARPKTRFVWSAIPGFALASDSARFELGLGYGTNWLPFVELPAGNRMLAPNVDFFVQF
ncbi:MAG: hypothetical protein DIU78_001280 [Pseudomonadota bacterium]|nr:MAG: hypothetical protein DIU78_08960 [Pseudomonadota bacterium]